MLRTVKVTRAALASHMPVSPASVYSRAVVRRFVGDRTNRVPNVIAINSITSKTKGEGLAGAAASVGRAGFYLRCKNYEESIAEVEKTLPAIQDDALKRLAVGIRLRARNELLDVKEAALSVAGGSSEMEVSTLRSLLREDYAALKAASPKCWLVEMAAAEFALYEGKAKEAHVTLAAVEKNIEDYIASIGKISTSVDSADGGSGYSILLLAFQLTRAHQTQGVKIAANTLIEKGIQQVAEADSLKEDLAAFKKEIGVSLTDEEAEELAYVLEGAHIRYHFQDYFPVDSEYNNWSSTSARKICDDIFRLYAPESTKLAPEQLEGVKKAVPPRAFYAPEDELQKFLSSPKKNILAELRTTFGPGPQSALSKADEAYFESARILEQTSISDNTAGSSSYAKGQNEMCGRLARQLLYRVQINRAVALTQLDRLHEAVEILDSVIAADEYVYMWKALLARGEANKRLGLISKSDKDFRRLSELKKNLTNLAQ